MKHSYSHHYCAKKASPGWALGLLSCVLLVLALVGPMLAPAALAKSKAFALGIMSSSKFAEAQALTCPLPQIPAELHENCFKSCCIARLYIDIKGKPSVKLLSSSGSEEIDEITLLTLKQWKFKPAMLDGQPVPSTKRIRVEFEID